MTPPKTPTVVDRHCGFLSPPLIGSEAELRFACVKILGHPGDHSVTLTWDNEPTLIDTELWRGEA